MNVVHLLSHLDYHSSTSESRLLARNLPDVRVVCLGPTGPAADDFPHVQTLDWTRVVDPLPIWNLYRWLRTEKPERLHVWGFPALRTLALAGKRFLAQTLVSLPAPRLKNLSRLDRWLATKVDRFVARSAAEAEFWQNAGIPSAKLVVVPPGVEIPDADANAEAEASLLAVGPITAEKGFLTGIYAFDILYCLTDKTRLRFVGQGSHRERLQEMAHSLRRTDEVAFVGRAPSLAPEFERASICWATSRRGSSTHAVLEAMAAGKPVIASAFPWLREIVPNAGVGALVAPNDQVALARQTRKWFESETLRRQTGLSARDHVARHFSVQSHVARMREVYAG